MSAPGGGWRCDVCGDVVTGNSRTRATQRRAHGVRHARAGDVAPPTPAPRPTVLLVIPKPPRTRRTRR